MLTSCAHISDSRKLASSGTAPVNLPFGNGKEIQITSDPRFSIEAVRADSKVLAILPRTSAQDEACKLISAFRKNPTAASKSALFVSMQQAAQEIGLDAEVVNSELLVFKAGQVKNSAPTGWITNLVRFLADQENPVQLAFNPQAFLEGTGGYYFPDRKLIEVGVFAPFLFPQNAANRWIIHELVHYVFHEGRQRDPDQYWPRHYVRLSPKDSDFAYYRPEILGRSVREDLARIYQQHHSIEEVAAYLFIVQPELEMAQADLAAADKQLMDKFWIKAFYETAFAIESLNFAEAFLLKDIPIYQNAIQLVRSKEWVPQSTGLGNGIRPIIELKSKEEVDLSALGRIPENLEAELVRGLAYLEKSQAQAKSLRTLANSVFKQVMERVTDPSKTQFTTTSECGKQQTLSPHDVLGDP